MEKEELLKSATRTIASVQKLVDQHDEDVAAGRAQPLNLRCVYTCLRVCVCVCVYVCMCVCVYVCMCASSYVFICLSLMHTQTNPSLSLYHHHQHHY